MNTHFLSLQLTVLNAGRRYLGVKDLAGKVFVTSGLGGMSGAQAKAAVIVGCIGVIAEVSPLSARLPLSLCQSPSCPHPSPLPSPQPPPHPHASQSGSPGSMHLHHSLRTPDPTESLGQS